MEQKITSELFACTLLHILLFLMPIKAMRAQTYFCFKCSIG